MQKGFPNQLIGEKILLESQLIYFSQILDDELIVKFGQPKKNTQEVQRKIIDQEFKSAENFNLDLLNQIKELLKNQN